MSGLSHHFWEIGKSSSDFHKSVSPFHCDTGGLLGSSVKNVIEGDMMSNLQSPTGCPEQTISKLAPNAYMLKYLSAKRRLTSERKRKLFTNTQIGKYFRALISI